MVGRGQSVAALVLLTLVVGYAVLEHGGDQPADSNLSLCILGLAAIAASFSPSVITRLSLGGRIVAIAALCLPGYIAFQLIPLPLAVLRIASPTRAEIADALA